jgi:membrane protein implicated in regulation of membrane protease activity
METLQDYLKPELIWFLVGLLLLLAEFAIPGLVIFFFGVGAWVVALWCAITDISINTQLIVFIVSSVLSLVLLRKWLKGIFLGHSSAHQELTEDLAEFVGERVAVKAAITPQQPGKVELHGTDWTAVAEETIPAGTQVEIIGKENLTLRVKTV